MPSLEGSRGTVWPELCRAMHVWLKEHEAHRWHALTVDTDRPLWVSHATFYAYGYWMVALCLHLCLHLGSIKNSAQCGQVDQ